jgi:hypothetical protein
LAVAVAGVALCACGNSNPPATSTTTTTVLTTQPTSAIWPFVGDGVRYVTPVAAARSFAVDYVGMTSPLVESFARTDARSGLVTVQPSATGPVTTVHVSRVVGDNSWWVTGATTPDIQVTSPTALQIVNSPMLTRGSSLAYEAVVNVVLRADGSLTPLKKTTVMGGGDVMRPFSGSVSFTKGSPNAGAVTYLIVSAKDGAVSEATVVRVRY